MRRRETRVLHVVVALDEETLRLGAVVSVPRGNKPGSALGMTEQATDDGLKALQAWLVRQLDQHLADFTDPGHEPAS